MNTFMTTLAVKEGDLKNDFHSREINFLNIFLVVLFETLVAQKHLMLHFFKKNNKTHTL